MLLYADHTGDNIACNAKQLQLSCIAAELSKASNAVLYSNMPSALLCSALQQYRNQRRYLSNVTMNLCNQGNIVTIKKARSTDSTDCDMIQDAL